MTELLNITAEQYHRRTEISSSMIRCIASEGPHGYYARHVTKAITFEPTRAMEMGTLTHLFFEHSGHIERMIDEFDGTIQDDEFVDSANLIVEGRQKKCKPGDKISASPCPSHEEYLKLRREDARRNGRVFVTTYEAEIIRNQLEAILANPMCAEIIGRDCTREQAAINTDKSTGLGTRALADVYMPEGELWDLKTTKEQTPNGFAWDAKKRRYHWQLDWYEQVFEVERSGIIAVTNAPPFVSMCYQFDDGMKRQATEQNRRWLDEIAMHTNLSGTGELAWKPEGYESIYMITETGVEEFTVAFDEE